jgi:hypothetical protein
MLRQLGCVAAAIVLDSISCTHDMISMLLLQLQLQLQISQHGTGQQAGAHKVMVEVPTGHGLAHCTDGSAKKLMMHPAHMHTCDQLT